MDDIEEICFYHTTNGKINVSELVIKGYCDICKIDERNKECPLYIPVKPPHFIVVKEREYQTEKK